MAEYVCELTPIDSETWETTIGVDLVRCRDCVHYSEHEWIIATDVEHVCHFWHGEPTKVEPDGYCAWATRKESE